MPAADSDLLLRQGQALESEGRLDAALTCYERARSILENVESPTAGRSLGVICMNRGSVLSRMGALQFSAALDAYDEAIALKRRSGAEDAISLAAALMNRGLLLHRLHGTREAAAALAAYGEAIALLRPRLPSARTPWIKRNLAGTLLNRANLLLDLAAFDDAYAAAREMLALAAATERAEIVDADLALKARRALCDVLGQRLVAQDADQEALAHEAADFVDEALELARHWQAAGRDCFRPVARRLFYFGAQLYRLHQPHFLAEFIQENLVAIHADAEFLTIARSNVEAALAKTSATPVFTVGDPDSERRLQTAQDLRQLLAQLGGGRAPA